MKLDELASSTGTLFHGNGYAVPSVIARQAASASANKDCQSEAGDHRVRQRYLSMSICDQIRGNRPNDWPVSILSHRPWIWRQCAVFSWRCWLGAAMIPDQSPWP